MLQASDKRPSTGFQPTPPNQFPKSVSLEDISLQQQKPSEGGACLTSSYSLWHQAVLGRGTGNLEASPQRFHSSESLSNASVTPCGGSARPRLKGQHSSNDLSYLSKKVMKKQDATQPRVTKTKDINFPLHFPKSPEVLVEFLRSGHDPNRPNTEGWCPIHTYISRQHKRKYQDLLTALLIHSSTSLDIPKFDGDTPLHMAVKGRGLHVVRLLVVFGVNLNSLDSKSSTPLDTAMQLDFQELVSYLHSVGALNSEAVLSCSSALALPRLKSFHEPLRIKEKLKKLRTKSLRTRRSSCFSSAHVVEEGGASINSPTSDGQCLSTVQEKACPDQSLESPNQSLENARLEDMERGATLLTLAQQIERYINLKLEISGSASLGVDEAFALTLQQVELARHKKTEQVQKPYCFNITGGSRVLFLDGGGIRGLIQIEVLQQLEQKTGRKVIELFDWIVGTSTGAIIALGLVYAKRSLAQMRQLYFKMKDKVFKNERLGFSYNTDALEAILQEEFGELKMSDRDFPQVIVTAVHKKTTMPELHFFNNCFHDEFSTQLVWKVARYTSAAPMFFRECDDYVDGGVLANNPCSYGLSAIQNFHRQIGKKLTLALVVSVGTGIFPAQDLGKTDPQEFLHFGRHWLKAGASIRARAKSLITLLTTALVESESVARSFNSRLQEQGVPFYRFNPLLEEPVPTGETEMTKLLDMLTTTKVYMKSPVSGQETTMLDGLVQLFHMVADLHRRKITCGH